MTTQQHQCLSVDEIIKRAKPGVPQDVYQVTSMLSWDERTLLYGLARDHRQGRDLAIVDAGCFVGGSTLSLASGLADRGDATPGIIHTYDRLLLEGYSRDGYFPDREVGDSLRPAFEANLARHRGLVTLHEGDVLGESWDPS